MRLGGEGLRNRGFTACRSTRSFSSPKRSNQLLGSLELTFNVYRRDFCPEAKLPMSKVDHLTPSRAERENALINVSYFLGMA